MSDLLESFSLRRTSQDNGSWVNTIKEATLQISDGHKPARDRLFNDTRVTQAVVVHEVAHAINEPWYRYYQDPLTAPPPPAAVQETLPKLRAAKNAVDDIYYTSMPKPCEKQASNPAGNCGNDSALQQYAVESYRCLDEGYALQELIHSEAPLPIGHPDNGVFEIASSVLTILEFRPSYIRSCLESLPSPLNAQLRVLAGRVLATVFASTPELRHLMTRQPKQKEAVDWLFA